MRKQINKQKKKKQKHNIINKRLGRQLLWYNPQNKISFSAHYCHESMHVLNVFKYFVVHDKVFLILLIISHVSSCPL